MDGEQWFDLGDEDKAALLLRATFAIDALDNIRRGFAGARTSHGQHGAFPRDGDTFIPEKVRLACAMEALALADSDGADRRALRRQGVSGVSVGNVSENYMRFGLFDSNTRNRARVDFSESLASAEAFALLMPYLDTRGVYAIL
ncbi:MAG: hypothetical protein FWD98_04340 [Defluviitaleaceae bacterium]|nr:hypothetical protein [Defluviitaleaceae bacterium]